MCLFSKWLWWLTSLNMYFCDNVYRDEFKALYIYIYIYIHVCVCVCVCVHTLEEGMATHSSILDWEIPWTEKHGRLESTGLHSRTWLKQLGMQWTNNMCVYVSEYKKCIYTFWLEKYFLKIYFFHIKYLSSFKILCL